jgi:hypothetical protein
MTGRDILNQHARRVRLVNIFSTVILIASVLGAIRYPAVVALQRTETPRIAREA